MTITLTIIGGILIVLSAVTRIPLTVSALIRACIPVVTAIHDLRRAIRGHGNHDDGE